jgi:hypothetical protein
MTAATARVTAAARVISATWADGEQSLTAAARALDAACLLAAPEHAGELRRLRVQETDYRARYEALTAAMDDVRQALDRPGRRGARLGRIAAVLGETETPGGAS